VDDNALEYAYANASVLIFPSLAEGFGLPLVEAMQRGLPVIASDIPVFRETGGEFVVYCDIGDSESLARMIHGLEQTGEVPAARDPKDWKWITWRQSAQQLVEAVRTSLGTTPMQEERKEAVA
jgi:glycosyltransferase involved in cell wall biosynthesis